MKLKSNDRLIYKGRRGTLTQIRAGKACIVFDDRPNRREWESLGNLICEIQEGNLKLIKARRPWWKFW